MGWKGRFATDWGDAMRAAEQLNLLTGPYTLSKGKGDNGRWAVRMTYTKDVLGFDHHGPIAICQAILVRHGRMRNDD